MEAAPIEPARAEGKDRCCVRQAASLIYRHYHLAITLILMTGRRHQHPLPASDRARYSYVLDLLTENKGTIPDTAENRQTFDQQFVK